MNEDKNKIVCLTTEYGGDWGNNHIRQLLHLSNLISDSQNYDSDAFWLSAYLHNWGAYPKCAQADVDHAVCSA